MMMGPGCRPFSIIVLVTDGHREWDKPNTYTALRLFNANIHPLWALLRETIEIAALGTVASA